MRRGPSRACNVGFHETRGCDDPRLPEHAAGGVGPTGGAHPRCDGACSPAVVPAGRRPRPSPPKATAGFAAPATFGTRWNGSVCCGSSRASAGRCRAAAGEHGRAGGPGDRRSRRRLPAAVEGRLGARSGNRRERDVPRGHERTGPALGPRAPPPDRRTSIRRRARALAVCRGRCPFGDDRSPPAEPPADRDDRTQRGATFVLPTRVLNAVTSPLDDATLAVSQEVRDSMPGWRRRRTEVVVHGVDLGAVRCRGGGTRRNARRARPRTERDRDRDGRQLPRGKGLPDAARGGGRRDRRGLAVRFVAVGQGPLHDEIHVRHEELGLGNRFLLLGQRPDAVRVLAVCDVFCLASKWEGLPVALMEALVLGLPVVATAVGGVAETVRDGREGLLVAPGRPRELADALARVVTDDALRAALGARRARTGRVVRYHEGRASDRKSLPGDHRAVVEESRRETRRSRRHEANPTGGGALPVLQPRLEHQDGPQSLGVVAPSGFVLGQRPGVWDPGRGIPRHAAGLRRAVPPPTPAAGRAARRRPARRSPSSAARSARAARSRYRTWRSSHLPVPSRTFMPIGSRPGELHDAMVQERHARLQADAHARPVDLGEDVVGQIGEQSRSIIRRGTSPRRGHRPRLDSEGRRPSGVPARPGDWLPAVRHATRAVR